MRGGGPFLGKGGWWAVTHSGDGGLRAHSTPDPARTLGSGEQAIPGAPIPLLPPLKSNESRTEIRTPQRSRAAALRSRAPALNSRAAAVHGRQPLAALRSSSKRCPPRGRVCAATVASFSSVRHGLASHNAARIHGTPLQSPATTHHVALRECHGGACTATHTPPPQRARPRVPSKQERSSAPSQPSKSHTLSLPASLLKRTRSRRPESSR